MTDYVLIFWTATNKEEAKRVASLLIEKGLVACASIIPHVESLFLWKGVIEEAVEAKIILKTKKEKFFQITEVIKENASYEVSEILMIPIVQGSKDYLDWLEDSLN